MPDGKAQAVKNDGAQVVLIRGPLQSSVTTLLPLIRHTLTIAHLPGLHSQSIAISNVADVRSESNFELAMRIASDIKNPDHVFYSDLNGFQMIKRKYWEKIPIQGNFYPMTSASFLEDSRRRLTLLAAQPLGVASLSSGEIQIMLDRRLMQDDNRGLFQGVTDNHPTPSLFRLLLQPLSPTPAPLRHSKLGQLTLLERLSSAALNHPFFPLFEKTPGSFESLNSWQGLKSHFPCDLELVNLRQSAAPALYSSGGPGVEQMGEETILILHRFPIDCRGQRQPRLPCSASAQSAVALADLFTELRVQTAERRSLTLMHSSRDEALDSHASIQLQPMDIASYKLKLS